MALAAESARRRIEVLPARPTTGTGQESTARRGSWGMAIGPARWRRRTVRRSTVRRLRRDSCRAARQASRSVRSSVHGQRHLL